MLLPCLIMLLPCLIMLRECETKNEVLLLQILVKCCKMNYKMNCSIDPLGLPACSLPSYSLRVCSHHRDIRLLDGAQK